VRILGDNTRLCVTTLTRLACTTADGTACDGAILRGFSADFVCFVAEFGLTLSLTPTVAMGV